MYISSARKAIIQKTTHETLMSFLFWIVYFPKLIDFSHWKFSSCLNRPSGPRPSFLEWRCPVKSWQQFHFHQSQQKSPWQKKVSSPVGKVSPTVSPWFLVSSRVQTRQMDLTKMATLKATMSSLRGRKPKRDGFDDWCDILTFAQQKSLDMGSIHTEVYFCLLGIPW